MSEDESLRSKYTRLAVEFKKLRERHNATKENLKSQTEKVTTLEAKLLGHEIHTRNLAHEKEILMFRNQSLVEQTLALRNEHGSHKQSRIKQHNSLPEADTNSPDDALNRTLKECDRLNKELVTQSSKFLAKIAALESTITVVSKVRPHVSVSVQTCNLPSASPFTQSLSSVDANSSLDVLSSHERGNRTGSFSIEPSSSLCSRAFSPDENGCGQFQSSFEASSADAAESVEDIAIGNAATSTMVPLPHRTQSFPTASNLRQQHRIHSEELTSREKVLLLRISLLEKQVTEAALQQHLDNRRIQLSHHSVRDSVSTTPTYQEAPTTIALSKREKVLTDYYDEQIRQRNEQLVIYAGRVADAYEEIRCLHEHLCAALNDVEVSRHLASSAETKVTTLEQELDSTKTRTAQQLSNMALHLANLTDDIHVLRGGCVIPSTNGSKVGNNRGDGPQHHLRNNNEKMNSFFSSLLG